MRAFEPEASCVGYSGHHHACGCGPIMCHDIVAYILLPRLPNTEEHDPVPSRCASLLSHPAHSEESEWETEG
jgi:hypothetical protein